MQGGDGIWGEMAPAAGLLVAGLFATASLVASLEPLEGGAGSRFATLLHWAGIAVLLVAVIACLPLVSWSTAVIALGLAALGGPLLYQVISEQKWRRAAWRCAVAAINIFVAAMAGAAGRI